MARRQPVFRPVRLRLHLQRSSGVEMNRTAMKMQRTSLWLALGIAFAAAVPMAHAANTDGALVGRVDAGASVTARSPETGFERTVQADANGNYRFPFLPVGTYTVQANKDGQP